VDLICLAIRRQQPLWKKVAVAVAVAVATNQTGQFSLKNEATFAAQLCFDDAQPETQTITTTKRL
jgi:hypothetical protein